VTESGSTSTVTVRATANSQRLSAKKVESVSFTVNVTAGVIPGAHAWTANAFIFFGCTASYGQPIVMTVTIGALPVNVPPVAVPDRLTVPEDRTLIGAAPGLLANDIDLDGDPLTARLVTGPSHGTLALAADGSYRYVPAANYSGGDSFTYRADDGSAASPPALVSVTVTPVNDAPVAVLDSYSVAQDSTLVQPAPGVLANDHDVDGPLLAAQLVSQPIRGSVTLLANGSFTYAPDAGFSGVDTFQYRDSDGMATSAPATVRITVTPAPAATPTPPGATPGATPVGSRDATPSLTPTESSTATGLRSPDGSPAATPSLVVAGGPDDPIPPFSLDVAFAGVQFDWFIPAAVVGGPGLLVMVAIALQLLGALAWLPAVRRHLGGAGSRRSGRST
jgi:VCBS repeat-containing protein